MFFCFCKKVELLWEMYDIEHMIILHFHKFFKYIYKILGWFRYDLNQKRISHYKSKIQLYLMYAGVKRCDVI